MDTRQSRGSWRRWVVGVGIVVALVALARPVGAQASGWYEFGVVPSTFDAPTYAAVNADVAAVLGSWDQALFYHWMKYGRYEGRLQTIRPGASQVTDWFRMRAPAVYHNPYNQAVAVQSILVLPGLTERVVVVPAGAHAVPYITTRWQPVSAWLEGESER